MPTADGRRLAVAGALALAIVLPARADISGRVVDVLDGDTIGIVDASNVRHRVRLVGIDAPERGQPGGFRAKESLQRLVLERDVRVQPANPGPGGVIVGTVRVAPPDCPLCGPTLDVGLAQVATGRAWTAPEPAGSLSAEDRARYTSAEQEARARRLGLWREREPIPPWIWRQRRRGGAALRSCGGRFCGGACRGGPLPNRRAGGILPPATASAQVSPKPRDSAP